MGFIRRLWIFFWRPSGQIGLGVLVVMGGIGGIIFWGGFNTAMEVTNTMKFCVSCHEMESTVYQEYKQTIHYKNASGVQATCSDCHVPKDWTAKVIRKVQATGELYHHFIGTIDTKEKFEAHRATMAKRVWASMEANDSQECRNCHTFEAMDFHAQRAESSKAMQVAAEKGETCISCHKGIAHKMPDLSSGYLSMFGDLRALSQKEGASADKLYTIATKDMFTEASTDGKSAGRFLPATELEVIERKGDLIKVRLNGWQQDGVDRVVYALMGQRIFSATLAKTAIESVERHQTEFDENTELTWHRVSVDAWTPKDDLISDVDVLWDYGSEMYNASCSTCHTLSSPDHLLANQWIGSLKAMSRFISLDKEQYRFLQKYLQFHASDTGGKGH